MIKKVKAKGKVSVQKGAINPNVKTMKTLEPMEKTLEDHFEGRKRRDGQTMKKVSRDGY